MRWLIIMAIIVLNSSIILAQDKYFLSKLVNLQMLNDTSSDESADINLSFEDIVMKKG
jgi:hypothetical protein